MGLATIDPHSHNIQTKLYKLPKFGVNTVDPKVSKIQPFENVNVWPSGRCPIQRPDTIHFFVNSDVFESLYLSQN